MRFLSFFAFVFSEFRHYANEYKNNGLACIKYLTFDRVRLHGAVVSYLAHVIKLYLLMASFNHDLSIR